MGLLGDGTIYREMRVLVREESRRRKARRDQRTIWAQESNMVEQFQEFYPERVVIETVQG